MYIEDKPIRNQKRIKLTPQQIKSLNSFYDINPKPGNKDRLKLSQTLGIGIDKIKNWFQNRRAKDKKDLIDASSDLSVCMAEATKDVLTTVYPNCNDLYRRRDI